MQVWFEIFTYFHRRHEYLQRATKNSVPVTWAIRPFRTVCNSYHTKRTVIPTWHLALWARMFPPNDIRFHFSVHNLCMSHLCQVGAAADFSLFLMPYKTNGPSYIRKLWIIYFLFEYLYLLNYILCCCARCIGINFFQPIES